MSHNLSTSISGWKLDPEESFSDWEIEVIPTVANTNDGSSLSTKSYHVHTYCLGVGPRKSLYFHRQFKLNTRESTQRKTSLKLEPSAAQAFPVFLDYMYTGQFDITAESAVALAYLGDYFQLQSILPLVDRFITKDISDEGAKHIHLYCREAIRYKNTNLVEKLMDQVVKAARDELLSPTDITNGSGNATPVQLMMTMLSEEQQKRVYFLAFQSTHVELVKLQQNKENKRTKKYKSKRHFKYRTKRRRLGRAVAALLSDSSLSSSSEEEEEEDNNNDDDNENSTEESSEESTDDGEGEDNGDEDSSSESDA